MDPGKSLARRIFFLTTVFVIAVMLPSACSRRQLKVVPGLRSELEAARTACAADYAPAEFARAVELVEAAETSASATRRDARPEESAAAGAALKEAVRVAVERKDAAREEAYQALETARQDLEAAESDQVGVDAPVEMSRARNRYLEAQHLFESNDCRYPDAAGIAGDASALAGGAVRAAALVREDRVREREAALQAETEARRRAEAEQRRRRLASERAEQRWLIEEKARARPTHWVITTGECLWRIAEDPRVFDDPFQWPLLWHFNESQIHDPDLVYPGQRLQIPRGVRTQRVEAAIREARARVWPVPNYLFDGK